MNTNKNCVLCDEGKRKRECKLLDYQLICTNCCQNKQTFYCNGCNYYEEVILKFKCECCGKTTVDELPSEITKLFEASIYKLVYHEFCNNKNQIVQNKNIYSIKIEFPFYGKIKIPMWCYYDPKEYLDTLQFIKGEIVEVKDFNEYRAEVKLLVHQSINCHNIPEIFSEVDMPEDLYDVDKLFPVGSISMRYFGKYVLVSSMIQDGGFRILIADYDTIPRIILFGEGFFNHWLEYAGNVRLKKRLFDNILNNSRYSI